MNSLEWPTWQPSVSTENIRLGPVLTDCESVPTAIWSPVSPFLRFVVTMPSRMKSIRTERCHMGLSREFVGTAWCTYGQSNTTKGRCMHMCGATEYGLTRKHQRNCIIKIYEYQDVDTTNTLMLWTYNNGLVNRYQTIHCRAHLYWMKGMWI